MRGGNASEGAPALAGHALAALAQNDLPGSIPLPPTGPAPTISISFANGAVSLSWAGTASDYTLEATRTLTNPDWQAVSGVGGISLTLSPTGSAQYFRLRKP